MKKALQDNYDTHNKNRGTVVELRKCIVLGSDLLMGSVDACNGIDGAPTADMLWKQIHENKSDSATGDSRISDIVYNALEKSLIYNRPLELVPDGTFRLLALPLHNDPQCP